LQRNLYHRIHVSISKQSDDMIVASSLGR